MSLVPGTRLGPYEIAVRIGVGGMGEVYRAIDTELKRLVAVKVLPAAVASEPDRLARLRREAELLASLNHPNIAVVHGLEDAEGTLALVMELVEGPTLADRIAQGPIPADEALGIAMQIADALDAAHAQGIIHRDLKPANVKVRPDGAVKILDFGLAKALEPTGISSSVSQSPTITTPAMTHAGVILGTAAYMSPEQARGRPVDKRADIWAFGVVLYEMLTGRPAFKGDDVTETLAAIVKLDPDWDGLPEGVSQNLVWVLRKCLEKDPKHRLRDIADVRLMLARAFDASPLATGPLSAGPVRTARRTSIGVAALVSALAIGVAGWALLRDRIDESASINRFTLAFRQTQAGGDTAFSADGQTLVYRALGTDGVPRLYQRSMDEFEATPIRDTEGGSYPFLSGDGRWLGYVVGRTLRRIPLSGGPAETLTELPVFPRGASWDVESIVIGGGEGGLLRVPAIGGRPTVIVSAAEGRQLWYPQVLPGSRAILFTESRFSESAPRSDESELQILEVDSGQRRPLLSGSAGRFVSTGHIMFVRAGALWAVPFDLKRLELRGTAVPVVEGRDEAITQFAVADTGSLAYVSGGSPAARRRLVWVDRTGREEAIDAPPRGYTYPRLSPDGTRAAIDVRDQEIDIWIWDLVRETLTRLTFDPAQDEYPVWTHDGRQVFFASFRENAWGVFLQAADGRGTAQRVGTGPAELDPLSLSPDGRMLVLRTQGDLVTLPLNPAGEVLPLMTTTYGEPNADVSPDGRWITYESNEVGRSEIYVRPFPVVGGGLWQISNGGGTQPVWARNGRELFYLAPAGLMSVPIQPGSSFVFGNARVVLKGALQTYWLSTAGRAYDVSPDGQRFLMVKEDLQAAGRIYVVQNWFRELNRLVATD